MLSMKLNFKLQNTKMSPKPSTASSPKFSAKFQKNSVKKNDEKTKKKPRWNKKSDQNNASTSSSTSKENTNKSGIHRLVTTRPSNCSSTNSSSSTTLKNSNSTTNLENSKVVIPPNGDFTILDEHGSCVMLQSDFFSCEEDFKKKSDADCLDTIIKSIPWSQGTVKIFGKEIPEPRLTCYYGDFSYKYTGRKLERIPFEDAPAFLREIKEKIEQRLQLGFNSVLLNYYRNGNDSLGWHSDDEKSYGKNPTIASYGQSEGNFGASRDFQIRRKDDKQDSKINIELTNNSLLFMTGAMQHYWQHQVPKRKNVNGPRVNMTFRRVVNTYLDDEAEEGEENTKRTKVRKIDHSNDSFKIDNNTNENSNKKSTVVKDSGKNDIEKCDSNKAASSFKQYRSMIKAAATSDKKVLEENAAKKKSATKSTDIESKQKFNVDDNIITPKTADIKDMIKDTSASSTPTSSSKKNQAIKKVSTQSKANSSSKLSPLSKSAMKKK